MNEALHASLEAIARDGIEHVDPAAVETLARFMWHTDEPLPDLGALEGEHRDDAFKLVARLSVFNTMSRERKERLFGQAREALGGLADQAMLNNERVSQAFVRRFWAQLSPLQTRQFVCDLGRPYY